MTAGDGVAHFYGRLTLHDLWTETLRPQPLPRPPHRLVEHLLATDAVRMGSALTALQSEIWAARLRDVPFASGRHVVIAGPTSSGKTTVAEMFLVRTAMLNGQRRRAVYTSPTRALTQQKWRNLRAMLKDTALEDGVVLCTSEDVADDWRIFEGRFDIACMVYEKATMLFSNNPGLVKHLGCVVIDELHMLSTPQRGPRLELLLAKLLAERRRADFTAERNTHREQLRAVVLTTDDATTPEFLDALSVVDLEAPWRRVPPLVYRTSERPIVVHHWLVPYVPRVDDRVSFVEVAITSIRGNGSLCLVPEQLDELRRKLDAATSPPVPGTRYLDYVLRFLLHLISRSPTGRRFLVFLRSKAVVESTANNIVLARRGYARPIPPRIGQQLDQGDDREMAELIRRSAQIGCYIHHADIEPHIRTEIEIHTAQPLALDAPSEILIATTTLQYGMNLAVTDVVLPQVEFYRADDLRSHPLTHSEFHNMVGRAGRVGKMRGDANVYVVVPPNKRAFEDYVRPYYGTPAIMASTFFGETDREVACRAATATPGVMPFSDGFVRSVLDALRHVTRQRSSDPCSPEASHSAVDAILHLFGHTIHGHRLLSNECHDESALLSAAVRAVLASCCGSPLSLTAARLGRQLDYVITARGNALVDTGTAVDTVAPLFEVVNEIENIWQSERGSGPVPAPLHLLALGIQRDIYEDYLDSLPEMASKRHWPMERAKRNRDDAAKMFIHWLASAGVPKVIAPALGSQLRSMLERYAAGVGRRGGYPHSLADAFVRFFNATIAWISGDSRDNVIRTLENSWGRRPYFRWQRWRLLMEKLAWRVNFLARTLGMDDLAPPRAELDRNRDILLLGERVRLGTVFEGIPLVRLRHESVQRTEAARLIARKLTPSQILVLPADDPLLRYPVPAGRGVLRWQSARRLHEPLGRRAIECFAELAETMVIGQPDLPRRAGACRLWRELASACFARSVTEFDVRAGRPVGFDTILRRCLDLSEVPDAREHGISAPVLGGIGGDAFDETRLSIRIEADAPGTMWVLRRPELHRKQGPARFAVVRRIKVIGVELRSDWTAALGPGAFGELASILVAHRADAHLAIVLLPWLPSLARMPDDLRRALAERVAQHGHAVTLLTAAAFLTIVSAVAREWVSGEAVVRRLLVQSRRTDRDFVFVGLHEVEETLAAEGAVPLAQRQKLIDHFEVRPPPLASPFR